MGKSSRRHHSRSPRRHKRRKRDHSPGRCTTHTRDYTRDSSRDTTKFSSREVSLSVSLDRILACLENQGSRIAAIEAISRFPPFPSNIPGDSSPHEEGRHPADLNTSSQDDYGFPCDEVPHPDPELAPLRSSDEEARTDNEATLSQTVVAVQQAEGKRYYGESDGSFEPGRCTRCVSLVDPCCWPSRNLA